MLAPVLAMALVSPPNDHGGRPALAPLAEVPFTYHRNGIIVPMVLNGRDTLPLLLDTGWGPMAMVDAAAKRLGLGSIRLPRALQPSAIARPPGDNVATLPRRPGDKPQETSVAVNPRDPLHAIVSYQQAVGEGSDHYPDTRVDGHVAWSTDGGKTWSLGQGMGEERYRKWFDASVTFDRHGHAFVAYLVMDEVSMTAREGQLVRRSLDGGKTWEKPITLIDHPANHEPLLDHFPNIVADNNPGSRYEGRLYEVWDRILEVGKSEELRFVRSTDDGKTWSQSKVISRHPSALAHTTAVGHDGAIYVMVALFGANGAEITLETSRDGGDTFEAPVPVTRTSAAACTVAGFPRPGGWPVMAIDPRTSPDRLFIVWGDCRNGERDIFSITSDDGGRRWTAPVRVNGDLSSKGRDHIMEWPAVDPSDGTAYVLFYDRRNDPKNRRPTITLARSTDGGRTYLNYAWRSQTSDPTEASLGDYLGLAANSGRVYAAWPETITEGGAKKPPRKFKIGDATVSDADWPFGPTAIRVGSADFRTVRR